jgi:hypothetical protein
LGGRSEVRVAGLVLPATEHHILKSQPEEDRFAGLRTERKHFIGTLKMIAYRAESSMAPLLREPMARGGDDDRALPRQVFQTDLSDRSGADTRRGRQHTDRPALPPHASRSRPPLNLNPAVGASEFLNRTEAC